MKVAIVSAVCLWGAALVAGSAYARPANPPTLHGFCIPDSACTDNGTNTPTSMNAPEFNFSAGGSTATGRVTFDILVPDTVEDANSKTFTLSGTYLGARTFTSSLISATPWTTGSLAAYLGISASPTNPIGNFLPEAKTYQPTATGFYLYGVDLGTETLPSNSEAQGSPNSAYEVTLNDPLPQGSFIVAFIQQSGAYGATSNSGAIFETKSAAPEPSTWAMMLLGFAGIGFAGYRASRKGAAAAA